jgi:aminobenzoyl-glutamate transport protein
MAQVKHSLTGKSGWLDKIERFGNALPDPVFIFLAFIALIVMVSVIAAQAGWSAVNPVSGEHLSASSLLSESNLKRLLVEMPTTLTSFPPLGLVLVVMMGAAVAERAGLFAALLGGSVKKLPMRMLTPAVFIVGLLSHHASDAAYVVLIPLAAWVYAEAGRHPLLGIAVAYAGISGAFAGNVIPGQHDVLLLGITQSAARLIDPGFVMNPLGNWWFTLSIGSLFTPIAWFVSDRIVEPHLGCWQGDRDTVAPIEPVVALDGAQRRGLRRAGIAALLIAAGFAALVYWPGYSPLFDEDVPGPARYAPFYRGLIAAFMLLFLASGWAYGAATGSIRSHRDVVRMMGEGLKTMAPYLVIAFFAAHFVAMFAWSNLGPILAIRGAQHLRNLELPLPLLLVALLLISSVFDLVIGSASAKWSAMAPIVVPMLMLLGVSPEMTTAAYRMGDSIFNIVTPIAANFPLVLVMCQRWDKKFGIGSMIALMLPYTIAFLIAGFLLVACWAGLHLPVGPGAPAAYSPQ